MLSEIFHDIISRNAILEYSTPNFIWQFTVITLSYSLLLSARSHNLNFTKLGRKLLENFKSSYSHLQITTHFFNE
jgi:hypothetical protein